MTRDAETDIQQRERAFREHLPRFDEEAVQGMRAAIASHPRAVIREPETGLVMLAARDCFATDFHLGEVLVTTAEVEHEGTRGHATVIDNAPSKAVLAAAVQALIRCPTRPDLDRFWALVDAQTARAQEVARPEERLIAATRVAFENMAREDYLNRET